MTPRAPSQGEHRAGTKMWGSKPEGTAAKPGMRLISWKPLLKGALRGFATVELPIGLTIADIPVLVSHGVPWATLPSKPQLDQDGRHRRDANGKPAYSPILRWRDKDLSNRFSATVVELVRAAHPGDLEAAGLGYPAEAPPPRRRSPAHDPRSVADRGVEHGAVLPDDSIADLYP
jgi:hypothetical protein